MKMNHTLESQTDPRSCSPVWILTVLNVGVVLFEMAVVTVTSKHNKLSTWPVFYQGHTVNVLQTKRVFLINFAIHYPSVSIMTHKMHLIKYE